jgi:hypothetical protein
MPAVAERRINRHSSLHSNDIGTSISRITWSVLDLTLKRQSVDPAVYVPDLLTPQLSPTANLHPLPIKFTTRYAL